MTESRIFFLNFAVLIAFLAISYFYRQHTRRIFWAAAIVLLVSICLLIGFGVIKLSTSETSDSKSLFLTILIFAESIALIFAAEKMNSAMKRQNLTAEDSDSSQTVKESVLIIPNNSLDTRIAREIFPKAIAAGMIIVDGNHFIWKESKVLLAYLCGRIYCNDEPELIKLDKKTHWKLGNRRSFPDDDIRQLFNIAGVGQTRINRRDSFAPINHEKIDDFFKKA